MADRLWREDHQLAVLIRIAIEARGIYETLTTFQEKPEDLLQRHRFSVEWLIEEILVTVRNYDKWSKGRRHLSTILDIRYRLHEYLISTLEHGYEQQVRLFELNHGEFFQALNQLEGLFGN